MPKQAQHADVRPSNIFVGRDGHATLIDLDMARPIGADADPLARCVPGTVEYLAPEAACSRHRVDGRSDLYSLGGRAVRDARRAAAV